MASLFWVAQGPRFYRHKYKQRAGTTNPPPQCKIKRLDDSKMTLDYRVRVSLMAKAYDMGTYQWAKETEGGEKKLGHERSNCVL